MVYDDAASLDLLERTIERLRALRPVLEGRGVNLILCRWASRIEIVLLCRDRSKLGLLLLLVLLLVRLHVRYRRFSFFRWLLFLNLFDIFVFIKRVDCRVLRVWDQMAVRIAQLLVQIERLYSKLAWFLVEPNTSKFCRDAWNPALLSLGQTFACFGCYVQRAIHLCLAFVELSCDSVAIDRSHLALILKITRYRAVRLEVALKASIR